MAIYNERLWIGGEDVRYPCLKESVASGSTLIVMFIKPNLGFVCYSESELVGANYGEYIEMRQECQLKCETYAYYEKYGINKLVQPDPVELDYLITVIIKILMKVEDCGLGKEDMNRLSELGGRLSVVLNMEESKVEAANNAINKIEELRKQ